MRLYRATLHSHSDRQGREYRVALAAGSLPHCAATAMAAGAGAEIETVGRVRLACLYMDRGRLVPLMVSASEDGQLAQDAMRGED